MSLQSNYSILQQERGEIEKIIRQNQMLDSAYIDGNLYVSSNYYNYVVYLFVALFLVFLLIRVGFSGEQHGGSNVNSRKIPPFIFLFLSLIIILNAILKN